MASNSGSEAVCVAEARIVRTFLGLGGWQEAVGVIMEAGKAPKFVGLAMYQFVRARVPRCRRRGCQPLPLLDEFAELGNR